MRLVDSSAPWGSLGCVRSISIPVRNGNPKLRSVHFCAPCGSFWCVGSNHPRPGVPSCALCQFPVIVGFARVRWVHSCAPCGLSGSFGCFRPIPVRPWDLRVRSFHSRARERSSGSFGCVRLRPGGRRVRSGVFSISVRPGGREVRSGAFGPFPYVLEFYGFGPFPYALGVVGFVRPNTTTTWANENGPNAPERTRRTPWRT